MISCYHVGVSHYLSKSWESSFSLWGRCQEESLQFHRFCGEDPTAVLSLLMLLSAVRFGHTDSLLCNEDNVQKRTADNSISSSGDDEHSAAVMDAIVVR